MNRWLMLLIALLVSGCATEQAPPPVLSSVESAAPRHKLNASGPEVAGYLTETYNNTIAMCRANPGAPPFLCSGVLLRATQHSTQFHFWNPNPTSTGVSFSYLRKDAKFSKLVFGYNNGFIFHPYFYAPDGTLEPEILCFFPVDGATTSRDNKGCGQSAGVPSSVPCQSQGITTAAQYLVHYNQQPGKYGNLCGFDVRDVLNQGATTAFNEGLKAQGQGGAFAFSTQNEFRLEKWGQDLGKVLPIEAVFYINDTGKTAAQYDQVDFKTQTGLWIPAIRITLPKTTAEEVKFEFIAADQGVAS
ncbi:hypothetical protein [Pseudomonas sp. efr-133-TYG-5]|uniref:hypothetical protein n=1 Tax=Pseudomonas sp. efr-133-TYG-5 TaxID=3040310 RepID=UPI00255222F8|nr:hypothetical protein [Pseudomonas sp. efr-133-TYG-5]